MEPYQERVIEEQKELAEKIVKLITFITDIKNLKTLSEFDINALQRQLWAMLDYDRQLIDRIRKFLEDSK